MTQAATYSGLEHLQALGFLFSRTDRAAELRSREPGAIVIVVVVV